MDENLAKRMRFCKTLPSIPAVAIKVVELANDPDTDMIQICDCIAYDPALSAKLIKAANSPMYKSRRSADNLRQAVSMLGTHATIIITLSFSLASSLMKQDGNHQNRINSDNYWRRTMLSALASRALGEKLGFKSPDDLFLAGLLQDLGILAFNAMMPEQYMPIFAAASSHDALLKLERETFGSGHDEVGYELLKQWKLPDYITMACLASHGKPSPQEVEPTQADCVAVSGYIADCLLNYGDVATINAAVIAAKSWLDLDESALVEVIEIINFSLQAAQELFEINIYHPSELDGIMSEAKELLAMHNLVKIRELEEKSQRDALTGAHNRGYFDTALEREFELSSKQGLPLTLAIIDLDHFKNINDTYGHPVGDDILIAAVRAISAQIRQDDIFARYGGEEFVVILPGTSLLSSAKLLVRLKDSISAISLDLGDGRIVSVTASFGVVANMDGNMRFEHKDDLIRAADQALYAAKRGGRNQIVVWRSSLAGVE
ncbi:MAG: GGDEF domain-containing protein [Methylophilaceae bacterium]